MYECDNQSTLDKILGSSMPEGVKNFLGKSSYTITIKKIYDERIVIDEFPEETLLAINTDNIIKDESEVIK